MSLKSESRLPSPGLQRRQHDEANDDGRKVGYEGKDCGPAEGKIQEVYVRDRLHDENAEFSKHDLDRIRMDKCREHEPQVR